MKLLSSITLLLSVIMSAAGCSGGAAVRTELANLLEQNGYAMYTPFRTKDNPGTIFVLVIDPGGKVREMTLSTPDLTFNDRVDPESLLRNKEVAIGDSLSRSRTFSASLAADLLSVMINGELATKYTSEITIELGRPQRAFVLPQGQLTANLNEIRDSTLQTLRFYKDRDELENAYFVFETIEVASLKATGTLKSEFSGKVTAEKLKPIAKASASFSYSGGSTYTVTFNEPMLIGYKASRIPDTTLGSAVSPRQFEIREIEASEINRLKRRDDGGVQ